MKKPYKFDEVDNDITCPKCDKPLKKNVLARVTERLLVCYNCYKIREAKRGHYIHTKSPQVIPHD